MRRRLARVSVFILLLLLVGLTGPSTAVDGEGPSWSEYRLGQFISSRGRTPAEILGFDNNGDILVACRDGCSRATLEEAGVPALESQLELMRTWSLLKEDGDELRAAIPVLDRAASELLAKRASELASELAEEVAGDVAELVAALEAEGWGEHAYAILFSYVLDGGVWGYFDELTLVGRRNISRRGAPWGGEAWAYLAERELEPHTSTLRRESISAKVAWVEPLRPLVSSLISGPDGLWTLFTEYLEQGKPASAEVLANLMSYGVLDANGAVIVPLIEQDRQDELFLRCDRLTTRIAEAVVARLNRPKLVVDLGLDGESQALVVTYHEVMWRLMEVLVDAGAVELPAAIADPGAATPADIGGLVVLTRSAAVAPASGNRDEEE